jgi:FkbM family methyltransferase
MLSKLDLERNTNFKIESNRLIELFNETPIEKRWAFGRNLYSEALYRKNLIAGFIDDFYALGNWLGLPVIKSNEIEATTFVIIASGGNTLSIKQKLKLQKIRHIDYFAFQKLTSLELPEPRFNEGFEEHFNLNIRKFEETYHMIEEEESKEIYEKLIKFRYTQNIEYLYGFIENQDHQYFDFVASINGRISNFIDIGGYHGENTLTFVEKNPHYSSVILIEPNLENFQVCDNRTSSFQNVSVLNCVLGSSEKIVAFSGKGTTGQIVEESDLKVRMETLDKVCKEIHGSTFIKMDVEGGEEDILLGGTSTVQRLRPILAISAYHRIQDFWKIPELVFSMVGDYSLYIRHYTETIYETVFYFIPKELTLK